MQKIIHLQDMSYSIPYSDSILEKIDLEVPAGEFLGVLGVNGSGKTTLMDLLMGFRKASAGRIEIFGEDPYAMARAHRADVAFLSQEVGLKENLSIEAFLDFHSEFFPRYSKGVQRELIDVYKLDPKSKIGSLSTGQQKKVQIVAGLSSLPRLILIDEITAVLDPNSRMIFFQLLQDYRKGHECTILLATNIAEELVDNVDRILFLKNKKMTSHSPEEIASLFGLRKEAA